MRTQSHLIAIAFLDMLRLTHYLRILRTVNQNQCKVPCNKNQLLKLKYFAEALNDSVRKGLTGSEQEQLKSSY